MAFKRRKAPTPLAEAARPAERQQAAPEACLLTEEEIRSAHCFACSKHPNDCTCVTPDAWFVLPYSHEFWRLCERCNKPFAVPAKDAVFPRCIACPPGARDASQEVHHGPVPPKTPELFATA